MKRFSFAFVSFAGFFANGAHAQPAEPNPTLEAREHYGAGSSAFQAKRFAEAALHFEAAAERQPHGTALYTAGLAWEQAGKPERAADAFGRALEAPGLTIERAAEARERVVALEKTLGVVLVVAPQGTRVALSGMTEVATPARLHAGPGIHTLLARTARGDLEKRDVVVAAGQVARVDLSSPRASSEVPKVSLDRGSALRRDEVSSQPSEATGLPPLRLAGWVGTGVGVACLSAGAVLGVQALDAKDVYEGAPTASTLEHARSLETWTNAMFVVGGLATAAGVALLVWPLPSRGHLRAGAATLSIAPTAGGVRLGGSF